MINRLPRIVLFILCASSLAPSIARGQDNIPIISGGAAFFGATQGGVNSYQPVLAPVLSAPLGDKWLVESRADLREFISRQGGTTGPYQHEFFGTLEYLQLDYAPSTHIIITAGRFLTPFGIFNERVSAIWINKFQDAPIVDAIGTGIGYSDGLMLRGLFVSNSNYAVNYETYFSTLSNVTKFASERGAGGRLGLFLPRARLEMGTSYRKTLQDNRINSSGLDLSWSPYQAPLEIKGEWAHSPGGHGYWIQAAYRLSQLTGSNSGLGRLEPVFRMQQFFRTKQVANDFLPLNGAQRPEFGLNYYLPREVRLNGSYARQYLPGSTDINIWEFGITYRFLFPLWPGQSR
jgi:hypothetical protein